MCFQFTHRFERRYALLTEENAERVCGALRLLEENPRYPSLRMKKIKGTDGIWEIRAGLSIRLTFEMKDDLVIFRNVGPHDAALKKP
jgi:mRNA-degrading endonuclease RelE of RelBE toxin-antitoxin system